MLRGVIVFYRDHRYRFYGRPLPGQGFSLPGGLPAVTRALPAGVVRLQRISVHEATQHPASYEG
jgi:hypothetical protein